MADGLDVVAVGVAHERAVVVLVVLGPHRGLVQHLGAGGHGGLEEGVDRRPVGRRERDVRLADGVAPAFSGPIQKSGSVARRSR